MSEHSPCDSPYVEFDKPTWSRLSAATPLPLTEADVVRLRALGDPIELGEVDAVYRPLSRLLNLYVRAAGALHQARATFLGELGPRTPFVIGVAGSVAVGKSTVARLLRELLARWPDTPNVELVPTDGFLFPNAELERLGLMERKGFPESYDARALLRFVQQVKAGGEPATAPVYSHLTYDIVPGAQIVVHRPDILIIEGLDVLQPARLAAGGFVSSTLSDYFDFSIYVDAPTANIRQWYVDRFLTLRATAFARPDSYFHRFANLDDAAAKATALRIWDTINEPNLLANILPTRGRATLVLTKAADHSAQTIRLRKV